MTWFYILQLFSDGVGQKTHTSSEPTEHEKLSHDNLRNLRIEYKVASRQLLAGIQASSIWEGHRAISLKTQRRLVSRLSVFGYMPGQEGTMVELLPNKVTKLLVLGPELEQNLLPSSP